MWHVNILTIVGITLALGGYQFEYKGKIILNTNISWMTRPLDLAEGFTSQKSFRELPQLSQQPDDKI